MIRIRAIASLASVLLALALTVPAVQAQTGSGTGTTDPNATSSQTRTDQYNTQAQTSPNDQTAGTSGGTSNGYPSTVAEENRDRGPDPGWIGLLGLLGLMGLKRRPVQYGREDEVRGGRPATV